jgi:hydrogenase maturation protease
MPASQVLIIGYGNTLCSDDGVGYYAAASLQTTNISGATILACHQLTPELAGPLFDVERVIFIDAQLGEPAGKVSCQEVFSQDTKGNLITHHVSPQSLLALVQILFGYAPRAWLCTLTAQSFELGEQLTPTVQAAFPELLNTVRNLLPA